MTESLPKTGSSSAKPVSAKPVATAAAPNQTAASGQAPAALFAAKPTRRKASSKAEPATAMLAAPLAGSASGLDAVAAAVSEVVAETTKAVEAAAAKPAQHEPVKSEPVKAEAEKAGADRAFADHRIERAPTARLPSSTPAPSTPARSQAAEPSEPPAPEASFGSAASAWSLPGLAAATSSRRPGFTPSFIPASMVNLMSVSPFRNYEDVAAFGKANFEALVQANAVFAHGLESLSKELLSVAQTSLEKSQAATKALLGARTVQDVVAVQADYTRDALDTLMQNSTRLGELGIKLATDTSAPLTARINSTVEKAVRPAAAASKAASTAVSNVVDIATSNEAVA